VEESFHVLDGEFAFSVGEQVTAAGAGTYVLVPRGTRHKIAAGTGGGRLFALMVRGGLEEKFFELGDLPPDGITDPAVRTAISPARLHPGVGIGRLTGGTPLQGGCKAARAGWLHGEDA
jgi:hypothetical protein